MPIQAEHRDGCTLLVHRASFSIAMEEAAVGVDRQLTGDGMDEHVRGHDAQVRFVLFVAGQSPRSKRARDGINRMFEGRGLDLRRVEIVDVLTEPSRVLAHGIVAVPTLMTTDGSSHRWLYLDPADEERASRWLDEVLRSGVDSVPP